MRSILIAALFVMLAPAALANDLFFPKWSNCQNDTKIQFIDFYLDYKPDLKSTVNHEEASLFNSTITLCAGEGRDIKIEEADVYLVKDSATPIIEGQVPGFEGASFQQGLYNRCLQINMPKSLLPGQYDIAVRIFSSEEKSHELVGCLHATWEIDGQEKTDFIQN